MHTALLLLSLTPAAFAEDGDSVTIEPTQEAPENDPDSNFEFETGVEVWSDSWEHGDQVFGESYDTPVGDLSWEILSYEVGADASAGFDDGNVELKGSAEAGVYVARVEYEAEAMIGSDQTHASIGAEAEAYVGADAKVDAEVEIGLDGVEIELGAEAFAGAKAEGEIPVDLAVCDIGVEGSVGGEASAGIGGTAEAEIEAAWSDLEFGVGGELAGTLGLGAGGEGEVTLDLGGLLDPAGTADCFWDHAWEAGEFTVGVVDGVWDAGWEVGSDALGGLADLGGSALSGLGGLFGGGDDTGKVMSGLVDKALVAAIEQRGQLQARQADGLVRALDGRLTPGFGVPGMCF